MVKREVVQIFRSSHDVNSRCGDRSRIDKNRTALTAFSSQFQGRNPRWLLLCGLGCCLVRVLTKLFWCVVSNLVRHFMCEYGLTFSQVLQLKFMKIHEHPSFIDECSIFSMIFPRFSIPSSDSFRETPGRSHNSPWPCLSPAM